MRIGIDGRVLLAAVLVWAGGVADLTAQTIPVTVGGQTSSLVGVAFDVPVQVDMSARTEKLGAFALSLRWDPTVLEFVGGTSEGREFTANEDSLPGGVLLLSGADPAGLSGKIVLVNLRLRPLVADTTTFQLAVTEMFAAETFADLLPSVTTQDRAYCPALGRYGDLDGDGASNSRDALVALSAAVGLDVSGFNVALGDVDQNGSTDARDALIILSATVGLDVTGFRVLGIAPGACVSASQPALTVSPATATLTVGQTIQLFAQALDSAGNAVTLSEVFWSTSNPQAVAVGPSGVTVAVDTGTAVVTATQSGGASASATITVVESRGVHWVDALAFNAENQIGSAALPYATISDAVFAAAPGDTVRLRVGRYQEEVFVNASVVIEGDTSVPGVLPFIAASGSFTPAFTVTGGTVEFHRLNFDTIYAGLYVESGDTVLVNASRFRSGANTIANVYVAEVGELMVRNSEFVGNDINFFGESGILVSAGAKVVSIDSSLFVEFGSDAVDLFGVDSLVMRSNVLRNNGAYGLYVCSGCGTQDSSFAVNALVEDNLFGDNRFAAAYIDLVGNVTFRGNRWRNSLNDGIQLDGHPGSVITVVSDSFQMRNFGTWMNTFGDFDSLLIDSTYINAVESFGFFDFGRSVVVQNSTVDSASTFSAIEVFADASESGQLAVFRNVQVLASDPTVCAFLGNCAAFETYNTDVLVENVTWGPTLGYGLYKSSGDVTIVNSSATGVYRAVYSDGGGSLTVDGLVVDGQPASVAAVEGQGIQHFNGSGSVTNSTFGNISGGVAVINGDLTVTNSTFTGVGNAFLVSNGSLIATNDSLLAGPDGGVAIQASGPFVSGPAEDSTIVDGLHVEGFTDGIRTFRTNAVVSNTTVIVGGDFSEAIDLTGSPGRLTAVNNTVSCVLDFGGGQDDGILANTTGSDSVTVSGNVVSDCNLGIVARSDRYTEVRGNDLTAPAAGGRFGIEAESDTAVKVAGNTLRGPALGIWTIEPSLLAEIDSNIVFQSVEAGIFVEDVNQVLIRDNLVADHQPDNGGFRIGGLDAGILLGGSAFNSTLTEIVDNRVQLSASNGIAIDRSSDTVTTLVLNNVVKGATESGIRVGNGSRALIRRNTIDSSQTDGILTTASGAPVTADTNNLTRSAGYGIRNTVSTQVTNAVDNWWNDALGPSGSLGDPGSTGDSVSSFVTFSPFAASAFALRPADTTLTLAPPPLISAGIRSRPPSAASGIEQVPHIRDNFELLEERLRLSFTEPMPSLRTLPAGAPAELRAVLERRQQRDQFRAEQLAEMERRRMSKLATYRARLEREAELRAAQEQLEAELERRRPEEEKARGGER